MRNVVAGAQFRRDAKRAKRRGKDMVKLREAIALLAKAPGCRRGTKITPLAGRGNTTAIVIWRPIGC